MRDIHSVTDPDPIQQPSDPLSHAPSRPAPVDPTMLKAIFEQAAIGIVLFDSELRYRQINPVAAAMTGNTPEQLVGRTLEEVVREHFGAEKAVESVACFRRVLETGQRLSLRGWSGLIAGKRYYSDWEIDRVVGERGESLGALLTVTDVTERASAEQSCRDREEQMRAVITSAVDGIITIDEHGTVEAMNPAAERLFGYSASEVIGRNINMLMPSPYHEEHDQYLANYLRTGQKKIIGIGREVVGRRKDGTTFPMYLAVSELHVSGRRMFTGLVHDLTERKQTEAELKQAKEAAEAANQAKDQFLATVSHELRTPLNAILGWVQLLKQGVLSEAERTEAIEKIEQSAHAQTRLIEDILDATRAVTGKLRMEMRPMPLIPAIQTAIDADRPSAEAKGIDIQTHYADALATVMGDASRLQQVFSNLLTNSIKFSKLGGRIDVHLDRLGPSIRVRIVDQGEGISPEFLPHLFERFSQDATHQRGHGGLGLGLSIVRHIVELHGGSITAESAGRGQGAVFIISLPSSPPVR